MAKNMTINVNRTNKVIEFMKKVKTGQSIRVMYYDSDGNNKEIIGKFITAKIGSKGVANAELDVIGYNNSKNSEARDVNREKIILKDIIEIRYTRIEKKMSEYLNKQVYFITLAKNKTKTNAKEVDSREVLNKAILYLIERIATNYENKGVRVNTKKDGTILLGGAYSPIFIIGVSPVEIDDKTGIKIWYLLEPNLRLNMSAKDIADTGLIKYEEEDLHDDLGLKRYIFKLGDSTEEDRLKLIETAINRRTIAKYHKKYTLEKVSTDDKVESSYKDVTVFNTKTGELGDKFITLYCRVEFNIDIKDIINKSVKLDTLAKDVSEFVTVETVEPNK